MRAGLLSIRAVVGWTDEYIVPLPSLHFARPSPALRAPGRRPRSFPRKARKGSGTMYSSASDECALRDPRLSLAWGPWIMSTSRYENVGPPHNPIVVMTDFGADSFYVGAMKGAILSVDPLATIVDLTHSITPYSVGEASFILARVFDLYRKGSVFLCVVDPGVGGARANLVFESKNRYVVAPDNGLVSDVAVVSGIDAVFSVPPDAAAKIRTHRGSGRTFLGRDVFGPVAAFLASGGSPGDVGERVGDYERLRLPVVETHEGYVRGWVRHVDAFGNILTGISGTDLVRAFGGTPLAQIRATINTSIGVDGIKECFSQGAAGELMVILNSWNLIEITVNQGRAVDQFSDTEPVVVELTRI